MGRPALDLTGQRFGLLTAVSRAPSVSTPSCSVITRWNCVCECGTRTVVRTYHLRNGSTTSCGCQSKPPPPVRTGQGHPRWAGDNVSYSGQHNRLQSKRGSAAAHRCVDCGEGAADWSYVGGCSKEQMASVVSPRTGATVQMPYCPHVECYEPRCKPCHRNYDNQMRGEVA